MDHELLSSHIRNLHLKAQDSMNTNKEFDHLINVITSCIKETIIDAKSYYSHPVSPWVTTEVLTAVQTKDKWYRKLKKFKDNAYYRSQYKMHRNRTLTLLRKCKKRYHTNLVNNNQHDPRKMWKIVNSIIKIPDKGHILPEVSPPTRTTESLAEEFNQYFCNVGPTLAKQLSTYEAPKLPAPVLHSFVYDDITKDEIISAVKIMTGGRSPGRDKIPLFIIKQHIEELSEHLTKLFNISFSTAIYPDIFKIA